MTYYIPRARRIAKEAHKGQVDKAGQDYFSGHLNRVAVSVKGWEAITVAYLHDLIEDTSWTLEDLGDGLFPDHIVQAVKTLTRPEDKTYIDWIRGIARYGSRLAIRVKIADIKDHLRDTSHIPVSLVKRYRRALMILEAELNHYQPIRKTNE